jgi:dolichyl-phosphate beta-glucosyltransferase
MKPHLSHYEISIIIPAYNEENRILHTLMAITKYCDGVLKDYELIVVDDCSKDTTVEVVRSLKHPKIRILHNDPNRGKGYSVRRGMLEARNRYALFSDSDLATPIEELELLMAHVLDGHDIAFASRRLEQSKILVSQPKYRQLMGQVFPFLVKAITGLRFHDTQCGFKLFDLKTTRMCFEKQTIDRFAFDAELLYIAQKYGKRIKELPTVWVDKEGSKVRIVRDTGLMLRDLFRIRSNDWILGEY